MRMYTRQEFIKLPADTIYSKVPANKGHLMEGLFCKVCGDSPYDFILQDLISQWEWPDNIQDYHEALSYNIEQRNAFNDFKTDLDFTGRDGNFNDEKKFVVWNTSDIFKLWAYLGRCIETNIVRDPNF